MNVVLTGEDIAGIVLTIGLVTALVIAVYGYFN